MACTILSRTISAVEDKRIVVSNSQWARPLPMGSNWTKIRFGLRWHIRDSGANLAGTPRMALGFCNGSTNLFGDATTTNFVGLRTNETTWTRTSANRYLVNGSTWQLTKKVNTTITTGLGLWTTTQWGIGLGAAVPSADRTVFFFDLTKGSPNYTFDGFSWQNTGAAPADVSKATFLEQMEVAGTPSIPGHAMSNVTQTLAVDESAGVFDHCTFFWDRTTPEMEICDIAIARLL